MLNILHTQNYYELEPLYNIVHETEYLHKWVKLRILVINTYEINK